MIVSALPPRIRARSPFPEGRIFNRVQDTFVPKLASLIERAFNETCESAKAGVVAEELASSLMGAPSIPWAEHGRVLIQAEGPRLIRAAFEQAANAAALVVERRVSKAKIPRHLDVMSPRALAGLTEAQRLFLISLEQYHESAILAVIEAGAAKGWSRRWLSYILLDSRGFGLDPRSLKSLLNYVKAQRALGVASDVLLKRVRARGRKLLRQRAERIAEWVSSRATNRGFIEAWRQGREAGIISERMRSMWITQGDERVCSECESVEGEEVRIGEPFSNNTDGPPLHLHDRCYLVLVWPEGRVRRAA